MLRRVSSAVEYQSVPIAAALSVSLPSTSQQRCMGRRAPKQGKPPILPPSKKVLYRVVHPPWQKKEDVEDLLWKRLTYNNAVASLRQIFREELHAKETAGQGLEAMKEEEAKELDVLLQANEQRNKERAAAREIALAEKWNETKNELLDEIQETLARQKARADAANAEVRAAIARSAEFVTKDNLEAKILEALEKPVVYDFAIDRNGTKFYDPVPVKYQEGTPTRQKSRLYDKTLGARPPQDAPVSLKASA